MQLPHSLSGEMLNRQNSNTGLTHL